jgi:hypothetical protein
MPLTPEEEKEFAEFAEMAERGELVGVPGTLKRGEDAAAEGRRLLLEMTGAATVEDAIRVGAGRPRLGEQVGPSPTIRARVPWALKAEVEALARKQNRRESEIIREAIAAYLKSAA